MWSAPPELLIALPTRQYRMPFARQVLSHNCVTSNMSGETFPKQLKSRSSTTEAYHFNNALPHVKPLPNAARHTRSLSFTLPFSQASHKAIGIDAAVVFPYFWMLLYTWSSRSLSFCCITWLILKLAW